MDPSSKDTTQKKKRVICDRCKFPKQKACICKALPSTPLSTLFRRCRIIVLQHPHELRRKNRSLPLVELALFGKHLNQTEQQLSNAASDDNNFVMKTIVGRRIGEKSDDAVLKLLSDPNEVVVLVFPHPNAMDLEDGLALAESKIKGKSQKQQGEFDGNEPDKKMTLIFIDASWKHAKEMDNKTEAAGVWPDHMIRVQLTPSSSSACNQEETSNDFIQRRFQIRAPPSEDHLSTCECLAWIASRVEGNKDIYEGIMKVLDYMVELWRGFARSDGDDKRKGGGSCREMTQKRRKITSNKK